MLSNCFRSTNEIHLSAVASKFCLQDARSGARNHLYDLQVPLFFGIVGKYDDAILFILLQSALEAPFSLL